MFPMKVLVFAFLHSITAVLESEFCSGGPRKTLIATNAPGHYYYPYFVSVYQCGGSCSFLSPHIQHCTATRYNIISLELINPFAGEKKTFEFKNHTSCGCRCANDPSQCNPELQEWKEEYCRCECKYKTNALPNPCQKGFKWDSHQCQCVCNQPPKICERSMEWSHEACGCVCVTEVVNMCSQKNKFLDPVTCQCYDPPSTAGKRVEGFKKDVLYGLMLAELLLLLVLFDIFLCYKWNSGISHFVYKTCRGFRRLDRKLNADEASEKCANNTQKQTVV